jgi:hypothetical protein
MGWARLAESLSAPVSAGVEGTESNKHMKAKGKNPLAFFHFVNPPLKGRKKNVDPVREVSEALSNTAREISLTGLTILFESIRYQHILLFHNWFPPVWAPCPPSGDLQFVQWEV